MPCSFHSHYICLESKTLNIFSFAFRIVFKRKKNLCKTYVIYIIAFEKFKKEIKRNILPKI